MFPSRTFRLAAVALCLAAAACTTASAAPERAPHVVTIEATDFAFRLPDTLPAGRLTLRMANAGPDLHHVAVVKLEDGHTATELLKIVEAHQPFPAWARELGGPNAVVPGDTSEVTLDLPAGNYAFICVIPAPDGVPHIMKGMFKPVVVAGSAARETAARHDAVMVLDDYTFGLDGALAAGRRTVRVENRAAQAHEVLFVQLAPGKTGHDVLAWLEARQGPPPGRPIGGTVGLAKGEVNYVTANFPAGEYALICFLPDAKDGKPHFVHGMMQHVTVR